METKKFSFYKEEDAMKAAQDYANEIGGSVAKEPVAVGVSGFNTPDEIDSWSGEVNALVVRDVDFRTVAYFAYWE